MNEEQRLDYREGIVIDNGQEQERTQPAVYPSPELPDDVAEGDTRWNLIRGERIP